MRYLSTFEVAEKWGISPRRVGVLCSQNHPRRTAKQEAVGLSQKMQRSLLMPESKAANISKQKIRKGGHNEWRIHFCPVLLDSVLPI